MKFTNPEKGSNCIFRENWLKIQDNLDRQTLKSVIHDASIWAKTSMHQ